MKLILDTHTFLYFIAGSSKLSDDARSLIENPDNENLISTASLWEMAIKVSLGRLELSDPFDDVIRKQIVINGFQILNIEVEHISRVVTLPFHHRDPFDRLLVAQALAEDCSIVSADGALDAYLVRRLW